MSNVHPISQSPPQILTNQFFSTHWGEQPPNSEILGFKSPRLSIPEPGCTDISIPEDITTLAPSSECQSLYSVSILGGFGGLSSSLTSLGKETVSMYNEHHGQSGGGAEGGRGLAKSGDYIPKSMLMQQGGPHNSTYANIKAQCLKAGEPWEDPDFKPWEDPDFKASEWRNIKWKRPKDICSDPQLFVKGGNRMDVVQGDLGDCWLLAALASLSSNQKLLSKVVPPEQNFDDNTGIFCFNFWQYGRWVEVLIDDLLPTKKNKLIFMQSDTRNEFWSALLEKAYAKLNGSYKALEGGLTSKALTDFTGGFVQTHDLSEDSSLLFSTMLKAQSKMALLACTINPVKEQMEAKQRNGLIAGHAYSITDVRLIRVPTHRRSGQIQMVRIRNPWGDDHEWNGAWSDKSPEWNTLSDSQRKSIGLVFENDGEFWMSYKDFVNNFDHLDICYLGSDDVDEIEEMKQWSGKTMWEVMLFKGVWRPYVNAGSCRNYPNTFWTNPQCQVSVIDPDPYDEDGNGMILVGLMQKERQKLQREGNDYLTIGYMIYKVPEQNTGTLDARFFQTHKPAAKSEFLNLPEVTSLHKLPPGHYVIVPSTIEPNYGGEFILRIFTERKNDNKW